MPERFELEYTGADNAEHRPVMIHRALLGSFERFIGILIEHYAGEFPLWLSPVQALILPIADRHVGLRGERSSRSSRPPGLRVELDDRTESVGKKIREGELRKAPYMLIVGDKEAEVGQVSVRRHREGDLGALDVDGFVSRARSEIDSRNSKRACPPRSRWLYSAANAGHRHTPRTLTARALPISRHLYLPLTSSPLQS